MKSVFVSRRGGKMQLSPKLKSKSPQNINFCLHWSAGGTKSCLSAQQFYHPGKHLQTIMSSLLAHAAIQPASHAASQLAAGQLG